MATDFITDTPHHKRWYLPDGVHTVSVYIYGDNYHMQVLDRTDGVKESLKVRIGHKLLYDGFIAAAERKYRARSAFEHRNTCVKL